MNKSLVANRFTSLVRSARRCEPTLGVNAASGNSHPQVGTLATFSPTSRGSFVSVALSLRSPLVAVSNCRILRCPDFPPRQVGAIAQ